MAATTVVVTGLTLVGQVHSIYSVTKAICKYANGVYRKKEDCKHFKEFIEEIEFTLKEAVGHSRELNREDRIFDKAVYDELERLRKELVEAEKLLAKLADPNPLKLLQPATAKLKCSREKIHGIMVMLIFKQSLLPRSNVDAVEHGHETPTASGERIHGPDTGVVPGYYPPDAYEGQDSYTSYYAEIFDKYSRPL